MSPARRFALVSGLTWLPAGLHLPVMVLLMTSRGLSLVEVGFVITAHSVVVIALELPTGALSDAIGRRGLLAVAAAVNLLAFGLTAIASTAALFAVAAALKGVGRALSTGPAEAWYVDTMHAADPDADLRRGLSAGHTASSAALAVGVLLGGFLPAGLSAAGWRPDLALAVPPVLAALACGALLTVVLVAMPEPPGRKRSRLAEVLAATPRVAVRGVRLVFTDPVLRLVIIAPLALGLSLNVVELLTPGRIAQIAGGAGAGAAGYAVIAAVGFGASALGSGAAPFAGRFLHTAPVIAAVGVAISAAGSFALAASTALDGTAAGLAAGGAYFVIFVGIGLLDPAMSELLNSRVSASERATVISIDSLALQFGGVVGAVTLIPLAGEFGPARAWAIAAVAMVGVIIVMRAPSVRAAAPVHAARGTGSSPVEIAPVGVASVTVDDA